MADQPDWIGAIFSENPEKSYVTVQAYWKNKESYIKYSQSVKFQETMIGFAKHFKGNPEVNITKISFVM